MATPLDSATYMRDAATYTSSSTTSVATSGTCSGTCWDEGTGDSNAWYFLGGDSTTACLAPGTVVRMAEPGQIIPVRSMDDLRHDPRLVEERDRRMRQAQMQMEQNVAATIGGNYQRGVQPRTAAEAMLLAQQEQQQAQQQEWSPDRYRELEAMMRRADREIERAAGMYPLPPPPERVPQAIAEGEESEIRTHIPHSHYERMMREQGLRYERNRNERQRRYEMQRAQMDPGSADNNVNPYYGITFGDDPVSAPTISNEHMKKREKAEKRAQELLGMIIGEEDLSVYKETGKLYVKGKKYEYIIQKDGFILQLKKDRVVNLCCHLEKKDAMPLTDNVIAMKLRIENEEKDVLKLANEWGHNDRETYQLPECAGMVA